MLKETLEKYLEENGKQAIYLDIRKDSPSAAIGQSKFEGDPDLPDGFVWPYAVNKLIPRFQPLSFIAQIDLQEAAKYDHTGLLPKTGYLFFFTAPCASDYKADSKECTKVFYFNGKADELVPTRMPLYAALDRQVVPHVSHESKYIDFSAAISYPNVWEIKSTVCSDLDDKDSHTLWNMDNESLNKLLERDHEIGYMHNHMLGYDKYIQDSEEKTCERIYRELYGDEVEDSEWLVLLQYLYIPNDVHITFFIRKNDLLEHRFDRVWKITDFS